METVPGLFLNAEKMDEESINVESTNEESTIRRDDEYDEDTETYMESTGSNVIDSPGGTRYWIPVVVGVQVPVLFSYFESLDEAIHMYAVYAEAAGFDIRKSTDRKTKDKTIVLLKYILCNKAGKSPEQNVNTLDEVSSRGRKRLRVKCTECPALIKFKYLFPEKRYQVVGFEERHNHPLVEKENMDFLLSRRQLKFPEMQFIHRARKNKIGAMRAHKIKTVLDGGYSNTRGKPVDWKNYMKSVQQVVGPKDAQFIIDKMNSRKEYCPNFSFEYEQEGKKLLSMFWADEMSKVNFSEFGDVLSFDATFRTNKYNMVFVPFTGIDNHKKSVTFGAGLLSSETASSYIWLLKAFLKAHKKEPIVVMSDQDAALGQAIAHVFTKSRHRLCMWHIMQKLNSKVGFKILNTTDFRSRVNKLVWDAQIEPHEFEEEWKALINELNLQDNGWLTSIYEIRDKWISAYFKGVRMSGLMKTTSRSESINSFFNTFVNECDTFLGMVSCFDSAMEKQRYIQRSADHDDCNAKTSYLTPHPLEVHASSVYTDVVFRKVQKYIFRGAWFCSVTNRVIEDGCEVFSIEQKGDETVGVIGEFKVVLNGSEHHVVCTCNKFLHFGVLCCHVFKVFIEKGIKKIPNMYIMRRWRKDLIHPRLLRGVNLDVDEEFERDRTEAYSFLDECLQLLRNDKSRRCSFIEDIGKQKKLLEDAVSNGSHVRSKHDTILSFLGVSEPDSVDVEIPNRIRNKGCGKSRRLLSMEEKLAKKGNSSRQCQTCFLYGHDTRTCPDKGRKK